MTIDKDTDILAYAYFRAGIDLRMIEPEMRKKVLELRHKHCPSQRGGAGGYAGPLEDESPWQSNAIGELEDFDDGQHQ